eukprot:29324_1
MANKLFSNSFSRQLFQKHHQYQLNKLTTLNISTISEQTLTQHELKKNKQEYYKHGPIITKSTRLAISISPSIEDIWEHIKKCKAIESSVLWCAMKRCIQLKSSEDLSSIMDFMLDEECIESTQIKGPNIYHWILLFEGLYELNDLNYALEWLNIMLTYDIEPNIKIFNNLIALCCNNGDMKRGLKIFEWLSKLNINYNTFTYAEMIKLYTFNNEIELAQNMLQQAKDNNLLSIIHYNYFLNGLSLQQRQNDNNIPSLVCINFWIFQTKHQKK